MREENDYFSQEPAISFQAISFENQAIESLHTPQNKKKEFVFFSRGWIYIFTGILYLLPFFYLSFFHSVPLNGMVWAIALGSMTVFFGLLFYWEKKVQLTMSSIITAPPLDIPSVEASSLIEEKEALKKTLEEQGCSFEHQMDLLNTGLEKNKQRMEELSFELDRKLEELMHARQEVEDVHRENTQIQAEWEKFSTSSQEELSRKEMLLKEMQYTIQEQRLVIEKKQKTIQQLEIKIQDLKYEIRSLLHLEEVEQQSPQSFFQQPNYGFDESHSNSEEKGSYYFLKLHNYVEMAQNFTGVDHLAFGNSKNARFLEVALNNNVLDMRRLFDNFREESHAIFLYSLEEQKLLFANAAIKNLLGWSAEKFTKDFAQLIIHGITVWNNILQQSDPLQMHQTNFLFASKESEEKQLQCFFRKMAKGPFANYYLGLITE